MHFPALPEAPEELIRLALQVILRQRGSFKDFLVRFYRDPGYVLKFYKDYSSSSRISVKISSSGVDTAHGLTLYGMRFVH